MKLQILIPQYEETDDVLKCMLDSIEIQQNVDLKNEVGVIIVNDGSNVKLSKELLTRYTYPIEYYEEEHRGVSGTRNACFNHAKADYVMFCDADDMFLNVCGLFIIFQEIEGGGFDALVSCFTEESRNPENGDIAYLNREMDSTFVHGKIYNRKFLLKNNIRWNQALTIHEDSFFNCLAQKLAINGKYCQFPFYLWKWRDESVCRHDPKYILKTYNNMLDSNTALIGEFLKRQRREDAQFYATSMIYDAYFTMNKEEWLNQENQEYRMNTELRFKDYYIQFENLFDSIDPDAKRQIIMGVKNRFFQEGMFLEQVTFDDWIEHIQQLQRPDGEEPKEETHKHKSGKKEAELVNIAPRTHHALKAEKEASALDKKEEPKKVAGKASSVKSSKSSASKKKEDKKDTVKKKVPEADDAFCLV